MSGCPRSFGREMGGCPRSISRSFLPHLTNKKGPYGPFLNQ